MIKGNVSHTVHPGGPSFYVAGPVRKVLALSESQSPKFKVHLLQQPMFLCAVGWAVSPYYAYQRTWKPFNPILGETYELSGYNDIDYIAEQVRPVLLFWR